MVGEETASEAWRLGLGKEGYIPFLVRNADLRMQDSHWMRQWKIPDGHRQKRSQGETGMGRFFET
jgi:hypothetical protein